MKRLAIVAALLSFVGCNAIRHLTGLDRHDPDHVDIPVASVLERDLTASGDISFTPTAIDGAPNVVRVFVKNASQFVATPGAWYEITIKSAADGSSGEYCVIDFVAQTAHVYNQPAAAVRAIAVESVPHLATDPGIPYQ